MPVRFTLDDAVARHHEHPDTFEIPDAQVRENLSIGDIAKLIFRIEVDGCEQVERMWVKVTGIEGKSYSGILDNDATCSPDVHSGLAVRFRAEHVIQVWRE